MKKALNSFLLIVMLAFSKPVLSQIDTVFWFAAPFVTPDHWWKDDIKLHFGGPSGTVVRLRQPALTGPNQYDTTFTIPASGTFDYTLWKNKIASATTLGFDYWESRPSNTVLPYGLYISSTANMTVVYDIITRATNFYNPETFSLKGQNGLGKEFVCPFQTIYRNSTFGGTACNTAGQDLNCDGVLTQPKQQINIVCTRPNTTVWITPKCPIVGHPAGVTYSVMLNNPGEVYTIENASQLTDQAGKNLTGTIIVSDNDIAVTVADDTVTNPNNPNGDMGCQDLMGDQIVPSDVIGTDYILNLGKLFQVGQPSATSPGMRESTYIVATENFTQVDFNNGSVTSVILNKGDTYRFGLTTSLTYVHSNKNVYCLHVSGYGCELGEAIIPPLNCAGSNLVAFSRTNNQQFSLNLLCPSGAQGNFTLGNANNSVTVPISAASFSIVPGTASLAGGPYYGTQINLNSTATLPIGSYTIANSSADFALGVFAGDLTTGGLFHYMSSFLRKVYTSAGNDTSICTANTVIPLNGSVRGGSTTGIWTTTNGTGTFGNTTNLATTYSLSANDLSQSQIKFVLSSTGNCNPVRDTMVLSLFRSPIVDAGNNATLCKNNITPVSLAGSLQYAAGASWSGGNGGSYGNPGSLNTTYLPSPADLAAGSIKLKLTSTGSFNGCPNTQDSLTLQFTDPPSVAAGGDVSVCANNPTVAISGSVTVGSTTGAWSTSGSGLFTPSVDSLHATYQLSATDISQGNLVIKLSSTNNGNCKTVTDSIVVTVTPKPNVVAGPGDTICSSNTFYALNGSVTGGASNGVWSTTGNGTFGNANSLNTYYNIGQADTLNGSVKLYLTSTGSNCLPEKDSILITIEKAPLVNSGPDNLVCDNQLLLLNGNVSGFTTSGVWSTTGTGVFTPDDSLVSTYYQPSALDISTGYVKLILTSTNNAGCTAVKDTVLLTFKGSPEASFVPENLCMLASGTFTDNSTTPVGTISGWYWDFGDGGTSIAQNAQHAYSTPGTYTITHAANSSNGCTDTVRTPIDVYFLPQALFFTNTVCKGNNTQFVDSTKSLSGSIISWYWNFGDGSVSQAENPQHAYGATGTFTVNLTVTSSFGCKDTINKAVTVIPGPHADFTMSQNPVEALVPVIFTDASTGPGSLVSWYWNLGDSSYVNIENPEHAYANSGEYNVTLVVKDINGCIDTARHEVTVVLLPDVPTAFSPNSDGQNDVFLVKGGPFKTIDLRIYNNWGQLIFESNDQMQGWDGTFNGTAQPLGVYVWVVDVETFSGKKIKKTGDVTLLR